jgi:hypothetical protein
MTWGQISFDCRGGGHFLVLAQAAATRRDAADIMSALRTLIVVSFYLLSDEILLLFKPNQ